MSSSEKKLIDDFARLLGDAADAVRGVGRETENYFKSQIEEFLSENHLVSRDQFDALQEMVSKMRGEMDALEARLQKAEGREKRIGQGKKKAS